jgi:hypothetical protein
MKKLILSAAALTSLVGLTAACTQQVSNDQTGNEVDLPSYNAADSGAAPTMSPSTTDEDGTVAMNSWDIEGSTPATPPSGASDVAPTRVDIEDLHSAYRSNAVAALNKYGSGPFLVTGQVKGVGEELGKMMVHFHTNDDAVLSDVSGAEKIQPYQTVTVLCSGVKSFGTFLELEDCAVQGN